jgi:hypothetical protein
MSEWWSYTLSDLLMFSAKTYYRMFELYNAAIWPAHLLAAVAGVAIILCAMRGGAHASRLAAALLAACWLWVAWAFHLQRYADINSAGGIFAFAFALQALLLLWFGGVRGKLALLPMRNAIRRPALGVLLFAMLGYPLLVAVGRRSWMQMELFGVAPDPTALATLGVLVLTGPGRWLLWPIPLLWSAITGATLWTMQAPDFWAAPFVALVALRLAWSARVPRKSAEI